MTGQENQQSEGKFSGQFTKHRQLKHMNQCGFSFATKITPHFAHKHGHLHKHKKRLTNTLLTN